MEAESRESISERTESVLKYWIRRQALADVPVDMEAVRCKAAAIHRRLADGSTSSELAFAPTDRWLDAFLASRQQPVRQICRVCLHDGPLSYSAFDYCHDQRSYINQMIFFVCSVHMQKNDTLPVNICPFCLEDLKTAYSFKKRCQNSDDIFNNFKTVNEPEVDIKQELADEAVNGSYYTNNIEFLHRNSIATSHIFDPLQNQLINGDISVKSSGECAAIKQENYSDVKPTKFNISTIVKKAKKRISRNIKFINKTKRIKKRTKPESGDFSLKCDACDFVAVSRGDLREHMNGFHDHLTTLVKGEKIIGKSGADGLFKCLICGYKSNFSANVKRHISTHTNEKPYPCPHCERTFARPTGLKEHLVVHTDHKPFLCDECLYRCRTKTCLRIHKRNKHSAQRNFVCDECGHAAKSRSAITVHFKTHTGEKKYVCDKCPYKSIQLSQLQNHQRMVHTNERPFACDACSYRAVSSTYLRLHMRTHTTVKRFLCDLCPYASHTNFGLKTHKLTHTGEKPHQCDRCDFKSSKKSSLYRHQRRVHTFSQIVAPVS